MIVAIVTVGGARSVGRLNGHLLDHLLDHLLGLLVATAVLLAAGALVRLLA